MSNNGLFLDVYLPEVLEKKEFNRLLLMACNGSCDAMEKLIIYNIKLVLFEVTTKFQSVECNKEDLVSIGSLGLVKAINTFNIKKGVQFSTYAKKCIDNEIISFLRRNKKHNNIESFDKTICYYSNGKAPKLNDFLYDNNNWLEKFEDKEVLKIVMELVNQLPSMEKEIIMLYFGFYDNRVYKQREIADRLHITRAYVSFLINKIVNKIRLELRDLGVIEFCESKPKKKQKILFIKK